jgi:serine/threonine protein kinase
LIGSSVGRYRIVEQLGAGGMGVVYRARDPELERDVVLKFLSATGTGDETARLRLLREARSISALNHPHICQVFEIGRDGGHDFIVMEMVPASLAARVTEVLSIPTIGIGAGPDCDAQVLVWSDMAGLRGGRAPRFVKKYADLRGVLSQAARTYAAEVASGVFPAAEHSFED